MHDSLIETFQVARFYNLDPEIVENWNNRDFLDRQEFMYIQIEYDKRYADFIAKGK